MKIPCSLWDATESEIFCPGYLSDLMVFWQHSYICMIVGEIGYRSFFSYHLSHNESNFLVALDVTHVLLNKITKSLLRSYCVVFNSTWENSWIRIVLSKMGRNKMRVVILHFLRKRLQAEPPTPLQTGLYVSFAFFFFFFLPNITQQCSITHNVFILVGTSHIFGTLM